MKAPAHTCTLTTPGDRDIRIERIFDATRDRVWRTFTEPALLAQWWGRGYEMDIDRMDVQYGGHWRFIEYTPRGQEGFEGRYREVRPKERIVRTSEWDGMPGHVMVETETFEDVGGDRTRVVTAYLFHTALERDGMLGAVEQEIDESYQALDDLLERLH